MSKFRKQALVATMTAAAMAGELLLGFALPINSAQAADPIAPMARAQASVPTVGPQGRIRAGVLACEVEGGIGYIIASSKTVTCSYADRSTGTTETYRGDIGKFGLDIGYTGKQYLRWVVFAPEGANATQGFGGPYIGVSANSALGLGFGANALIGGSDKSFVLQPVSVQTGTGINVALGVTSLTLART